MKDQELDEILSAVSSNDAERVKEKLSKIEDIDEPPFKDGTWLHYAAMHRATDVIKLLLSNGANPNATGSDGRTPLHKAVKSQPRSLTDKTSAADVVRILSKNGADPNIANHDGETPLIISFMSFEISNDMIKALLEAGANPNATDNKGNSAIKLASYGSTSDPACIERIQILESFSSNSSPSKGLSSGAESNGESEESKSCGLLREDIDDEVLLVEGSLEKVAEAVIALSSCDELIYPLDEHDVSCRDEIYAIYQAADNPWIQIQSLLSQSSENSFLSYAQKISETLKTTTISIQISDTAFCSSYKEYSKGNLVAKIEFDEEQDPIESIEKYLIEKRALIVGWSHSERTTGNNPGQNITIQPPQLIDAKNLGCIR